MMIIAEVAVAVTIVAGTGLLVRSFLNLQRNDPGFASRGRLTFDVLLPFQKYRGPGVQQAWQQTLFTRLRNIRGVTAVAGSSDFPLRPDNLNGILIQLDDWTEEHEHNVAPMHVVTPAFFDVMGMRLQRGRVFTADDRPTTAPVAIVNESFARKYIGNRDPLMAHVLYGFPRVDLRLEERDCGRRQRCWVRVSCGAARDPAFYVVDSQAGENYRLHVVVATNLADPNVVIPESACRGTRDGFAAGVYGGTGD